MGFLEKQFGYTKKLDYAFLINNKNKIYLINKGIADISLENLRINSLGLYFGEMNDSEIRLSIEGSQLIGNQCTKNILELNEAEAKDWLKGIDLEKESDNRAYLLLKYNNDFLGCGKSINNRLLNFVPKNRRLKVSS